MTSLFFFLICYFPSFCFSFRRFYSLLLVVLWKILEKFCIFFFAAAFLRYSKASANWPWSMFCSSNEAFRFFTIRRSFSCVQIGSFIFFSIFLSCRPKKCLKWWKFYSPKRKRFNLRKERKSCCLSFMSTWSQMQIYQWLKSVVVHFLFVCF